MKVGDLVKVGMAGFKTEFVSFILDICTPESHPNHLHMVRVLERGKPKWYPIGYIEVINERG